MAQAAGIIAIVGAVANAASKGFAGFAKAGSLDAEKDIATQAAERAKDEGEANARTKRAAGRRASASIMASAAAGGSSAGSAIDLSYDSAVQSELAAQVDIYKGNVASAGYSTKSNFAEKGRDITLFNTLLGLGGSAADIYGKTRGGGSTLWDNGAKSKSGNGMIG